MGVPADIGLAALGGIRARSRFYIVFSGILLAIVLLGFSPSFFLNAYMAKRPIPAHVFMHGVFGTSWFVLLFLQTLLVGTGQTPLHRRIGWAGLPIALAMVVATAVAGVLVQPRLVALGLPPAVIDQVLQMPRLPQIIRDAGGGVGFAAYVLLALHWRRDVQTHKRLMLLGSMMLSGAAINRLGWIVPLPPLVLTVVIFGGLLAALVWNDMATLGRVHRATAIGIPVFIFYHLLLMAIIPALLG